MLRLNPGDNQGLRYTLVPWLVTLERDDEAEAFLEQHPGAEGNVGFTRALIAFRREGDTPTSRHWLKIGDEQNRFIAPWMLGDDPFPAEDPQSYSHGSPEEARFHVRSMRCAWRSTPGAIAWMRRTLASLGGSSGSATGTFRPAAADRSRLARLPMSYETWQAGFRQIPTRLKAGDDLVIPWVILVNSRTSGQVIESAMLEEAPGPRRSGTRSTRRSNVHWAKIPGVPPCWRSNPTHAGTSSGRTWRRSGSRFRNATHSSRSTRCSRT